MLDFEEELKRFKPSVEVANIEDEILNVDIIDAKDVLYKLLEKEFKEQK